MKHIRYNSKYGLMIVVEAVVNEERLTLRVFVKNTTDEPILLHRHQSPTCSVSLAFSDNFFSCYKPLKHYPKTNHKLAFVSLAPQHSLCRTFEYEKFSTSSESFSVVAGYKPFGDGAWGEFPHEVTIQCHF